MPVVGAVARRRARSSQVARCPGRWSLHLDDEELRRALAFDRELDLAAAGVAEGVARDLGHRGRDARLVLRLEAEQRGELARALARDHDVLLVADGDGDEAAWLIAPSPLRSATTVASSRPRL